VTRVRLAEAAPGLFMIALSGAIILGTSGLSYWSGVTPGPRFLPVWLAGAGLAVALAFLVAVRRGEAGGALDLPDASAAVRVGLVVLAMVSLPLTAPVVGMVTSVALLVAFLLLVVLRQRLVPSLATTAIIAVGVDLVFVRWLRVPLPSPGLF
jgi:hypothetical protein